MTLKQQRLFLYFFEVLEAHLRFTESLPLSNEVKEGAMQVEGIENVDLELVWDPPWNKDMMSDAAKLELNL